MQLTSPFLLIAIGAFVICSIIFVVFLDNDDKIKPNSEIIVPNEYIENETSIQWIENEFTVNMNYTGMNHGDTITISGTVSEPNTSITGTILHNADKPNVTIVQIFQLVADDHGFYTYDARINDDYLWKQEGKYTISIQSESEYKELVFHRGLQNE